MIKYITIENQTFEATLILSTPKTNDDVVRKIRKNGTGEDKNHFLVSKSSYEEFGRFFPSILKDQKEGKTNRNKKNIKNYFSISGILHDLDLVNDQIKKDYPKEEIINVKIFLDLISSISKRQNSEANFYIESEIGAASNGIGFKTWEDIYSNTIKLLLLHNTKTNIYLFKNEGEICSYFEFNQYKNTTHPEDEFQNKISKSTSKRTKKGPQPKKPQSVISLSSVFKRSPGISKSALIDAKYECQINTNHTTFINRNTKENYVEAHHLIPMEFYDTFKNCIDRESNIISLCPNCHKEIHFSDISNINNMLRKLLTTDRKKLLGDDGISVTKKKLLSFYK